jgi:hypothetical protein
MRSLVCWLSSPVVANLAAIFTAVGTVSVAALALFGHAITGPRLRLALARAQGNFYRRANAKNSVYYHIEVRNRPWFSKTTAEQVRVSVTGICRRGPDGKFSTLEPVVFSAQLFWAPSEMREPFRAVTKREVADFGFLVEDGNEFRLNTIWSSYSRSGVMAGEAMRVEVTATGSNIYSAKKLFLEVAWDGTWSNDLDELRRHLVVKPVDKLRD